MSIKIYQSNDELIQKLKNRNLIFDEEKLAEVLRKYSYFNLFNGIENILLESNNPKYFENVKLEDFLNIYEFDKNLSINILEIIYHIEEKLKTSISSHVSAKYCSNLNSTMQYTNKNNFMNPLDCNPNSNTYCRYSENYPFQSYQYKKYYNEFNDFVLFKPYFLTNLINQNDFIDISFYTDCSYNAPDNVAVYRDFNNNNHYDIAVPIWIAILTLSFGQTVRFTHYLKDEIMVDVMKDFGMELSKRNQFLNILDFILLLRNSCAHNRLVYRFETPKNTCINSLLIRTFDLLPKNISSNRASVLSLHDVMKILSFFSDTSNLLNIFDITFSKNLISMGNKKGNKINKKILTEIGCKNYEELVSTLNGKEYHF